MLIRDGLEFQADNVVGRQENNDRNIVRFQTAGLNFSSGDEEFVFRTLEEGALKVLDVTDSEIPDEVNVYAAGLFPSEEVGSPYQMLKTALSNKFPGAEINLENDVLASARALFGNKPGIACILGTGSNTCVYDGTAITWKVSSGGFILGDEGSASALGKSFIEDFIKGLVPECVALAFKEKYDLDYATVVKNVYHGTSPAAYLGKFALDILAFYDSNPYMANLVDDNFRRFFERCLIPCIAACNGHVAERAKCTSLPMTTEDQAGKVKSGIAVGIVGGFGYACRNIISRIAEDYGITNVAFLAAPAERLIRYHQTPSLRSE